MIIGLLASFGPYKGSALNMVQSMKEVWWISQKLVHRLKCFLMRRWTLRIWIQPDIQKFKKKIYVFKDLAVFKKLITSPIYMKI